MPEEVLDKMMSLEQAVDEALAKQVDKHRMTLEQRNTLQGKVGEVWDHVFRLMTDMTGTAIEAKVNNGIVDHPIGEDGETVKGSINFEDLEKALLRKQFLDHPVWLKSVTVRKKELNDFLVRYRSVAMMLVQIIRFVLCQEPCLQHLQPDAPSEEQVKAWAAFDTARLQYAEVTATHIAAFRGSFLQCVQDEAAKSKNKAYDNIKSVLVQIGGGAHGGVSKSTAAGLRKRLPPNGPINDLIDAFLQVVECSSVCVHSVDMFCVATQTPPRTPEAAPASRPPTPIISMHWS